MVGHSVKIATAGLAGGLAALSLTLSIVSGFEWTLAAFVSRQGGHILHQNSWLSYADLKKRVEQAPPGPKSVEIFWAAPALIVGAEGGRGVKLEATRRFDSIEKFLEADLAAPPSASSESQEPELAIEMGKALADSLKLKVGDRVRLLLPGVIKGSLNVSIQEIRELGVYDLESRWIRMDEAVLREEIRTRDPQAYASRLGDAHGIRYFFEDRFNSPAATQRLEDWKTQYEIKLVEAHVDGAPFLRTWAEQRKNLFGSIGIDKLVLAVVLGLLCLVAALNIAAALVVLFLERDREIAVLRAVGLSRLQLLSWILIQGTLMGFVASAAGLLLGQVMGWVLQRLPIAQLPSEIYNLKSLPMAFVWNEQLWVFVFGVFAACLLSFVMGLSLMRTPFLETLRHRS
jgi:lipoprotein-releasing system permease protein